jgi:hypothetical protein
MIYAASAAALLAISCLTLAWWGLEAWRTNRHIFHLVLGLVALGAAVILPLAVRAIPQTWPIGLLIVVSIDGGVLGPALKTLSHRRRLWLTSYNLVGSALAVGLAIGLALYGVMQENQRIDARLTTLATEVTTTGNGLDSQLRQEAGTLQVASPTAIAQMQRLLITDAWDSLTYVNASGSVVIRAENPSQTGTNLWQVLPWLAPGNRATALHGFAHLETGQPAWFSAVPLNGGGELVGVRDVRGVSLQTVDSTADWGIADSTGLQYAGKESVEPWQSAQLDTLVSSHLTDGSYRQPLSQGTMSYLLAAKAIPTLDGKPAQIILIDHE